MDELENQELNLEDILRDFGSEEEDAEVLEEVTVDTIRLDEIQEAVAQTPEAETIPLNPEAEPTQQIPQEEPAAEPFSEAWEPDYEQPGEGFPEQKTIPFENRDRLRRMRHDIVAGPEQRYYYLLEKGTGKLKLLLAVNTLLFLVLAVTTAMHAMSMVGQAQMKLVVFIQLAGLLLSGLVGCNCMIDGIYDICRLKLTANGLLAVTFIACCVDNVICLQQLRVSMSAVFVLEVSMALWAMLQQRNTELAQMDTMRRASRLDSVICVKDYHQGKDGYCAGQGEVHHFMDTYAQPTLADTVMRWYALGVLVVSIVLCVVGSILHGWNDGIQLCVGALLLGMPATAFVLRSRPEALLNKRLSKLGTVLCGWKGVKAVGHRGIYPIEDGALFPAGSIKLGGIKFFGQHDPDQVVAYATAVVKAGGGALVSLFSQLLDSRNGYYFTVEEFKRYNAGIGGQIGGVEVLVGTRQFMEETGVDMTHAPKVSQAVFAAVDGELAGVFALSYHRHKLTAAGLQTLCKYHGLEPTVVSEDFMLNGNFIEQKFGVSTKRIRFPEREEYLQMLLHQPQESDTVVALTVREGLAPKAFAVTGARALKTTLRAGLIVHLIGGILGLLIAAALAVVGITGVLTPANVLLYELLWMVPGLLITEWTRSL